MADAANTPGWDGPGSEGRPKARFRWRIVVWALIYPRRHHHMVPTISGILLIALSLGIGTAAYNSSNNILFITLSLLLACLILSGVLSWLNFAQLRWRLFFPATARAQTDTTLTLELLNGKKMLPTYGLECTLVASPVLSDVGHGPETTFTARGKDVKAIFNQVPAQVTGRLVLTGRLDAQATSQLHWSWQPPRRGQWEVIVRDVASFFPFGFFNKKLAADLKRTLTVWPAIIEYQRHPVSGFRWAGVTERLARAGSGNDLLALRRYAPGDSHRLINWKASARTGQLLVRQFAAEATESYTLWLRTDIAVWPRPDQFERALSLVATLGEDLFRADRLHAVRIDGHNARIIRHGRDFEALLDELAQIQPNEKITAPMDASTGGGHRNQFTFMPDGTTGVIALIDGTKAATA
jgi:uncharacterized protein (DUF58 family)